MDNNFKDAMSQRTDQELIKIVTLQREDYQPLAVEAAEREIDLRNIDMEKIEKLKQEFTKKRDEQKKIDLNFVSSLTRLLNFLVDSLIIFLLAIILSIIPGIFKTNYTIPQVEFITCCLIFVSFMLYYVILEFKYQKTVGKYITKTKVVMGNGNIPTFRDILIRTIFRLIPLDRLSYVFTTNGFHDFLSNTTVKKDKN